MYFRNHIVPFQYFGNGGGALLIGKINDKNWKFGKDSLASPKNQEIYDFHGRDFHNFPIGNFLVTNSEKKILSGIGNGALFRPQIKRKRNTESESE